jgi:hypothetical protein
VIALLKRTILRIATSSSFPFLRFANNIAIDMYFALPTVIFLIDSSIKHPPHLNPQSIELQQAEVAIIMKRRDHPVIPGAKITSKRSCNSH